MEGLSLSEDPDLLLFRVLNFDRDLEDDREDLDEDRLDEDEEREPDWDRDRRFDRDRTFDRERDRDFDTEEEYFDRFRFTVTGVLSLGPPSQSERSSSGFGKEEGRLGIFEEEEEGVSFVVTVAEVEDLVTRAGNRFESTANI